MSWKSTTGYKEFDDVGVGTGYSNIRFMRLKSTTSFIAEVIVECLSNQRMALTLRRRFPLELGENLVDDSMRVHSALDFFGARIRSITSTFEVVVKLLELFDIVLAEPNGRYRGRIDHNRAVSGQADKHEEKP